MVFKKPNNWRLFTLTMKTYLFYMEALESLDFGWLEEVTKAFISLTKLAVSTITKHVQRPVLCNKKVTSNHNVKKLLFFNDNFMNQVRLLILF